MFTKRKARWACTTAFKYSIDAVGEPQAI